MERAPSDRPIPMKYESLEGPLSKAQRFSAWCLTAMSQDFSPWRPTTQHFSPCETYPGEKRAVGRSAAKVAGL